MLLSMEPLPELIQTQRLTLRRWVPGDEALLAAAVDASRDHLVPWMPWASTDISLAERRELITGWDADWRGGGDIVLGVFLDEAVIGGTGLHTRRGPAVLEVGYWIHPAHVGQGYATEIAEAQTTVAFAAEEIERVEIHCDRANGASGRVPEKLGFALTSEEPRPIEAPGESGVTCCWTMTRAEWARRGSHE